MQHTMVPSDRVEHVGVYGRNGVKLGTIERLMLDKVSGTVAYAVIRTGGLHRHAPSLSGAVERAEIRPARQAFRVDVTLDELASGPCEFDGAEFDWGDR